MWFGIHLVRSGRVTADQLLEATERQLEAQVQLGRLAVTEGLMTLADVKQVLLEQAKTQRQFGQCAVDCGYLSEQNLAHLLMLQAQNELPIDEVLIRLGYLTPVQADRAQKEFRSRMKRAFDEAQADAATSAVYSEQL